MGISRTPSSPVVQPLIKKVAWGRKKPHQTPAARAERIDKTLDFTQEIVDVGEISQQKIRNFGLTLSAKRIIKPSHAKVIEHFASTPQAVAAVNQLLQNQQLQTLLQQVLKEGLWKVDKNNLDQFVQQTGQIRSVLAKNLNQPGQHKLVQIIYQTVLAGLKKHGSTPTRAALSLAPKQLSPKKVLITLWQSPLIDLLKGAISKSKYNPTKYTDMAKLIAKLQ